MSLALAGQRFALFKTLAFCPATRIIWGIDKKKAAKATFGFDPLSMRVRQLYADQNIRNAAAQRGCP
ncbi:hypothetical protein PEC311524_16070 [Pectobacterium carotovorum subsp. carotovorum]|nr:hypothetical protein PEC311524_16070 [Pectobacterium carotovorum subsp. carotovorum]